MPHVSDVLQTTWINERETLACMRWGRWGQWWPPSLSCSRWNSLRLLRCFLGTLYSFGTIHRWLFFCFTSRFNFKLALSSSSALRFFPSRFGFSPSAALAAMHLSTLHRLKGPSKFLLKSFWRSVFFLLLYCWLCFAVHVGFVMIIGGVLNLLHHASGLQSRSLSEGCLHRP